MLIIFKKKQKKITEAVIFLVDRKIYLQKLGIPSVPLYSSAKKNTCFNCAEKNRLTKYKLRKSYMPKYLCDTRLHNNNDIMIWITYSTCLVFDKFFYCDPYVISNPRSTISCKCREVTILVGKIGKIMSWSEITFWSDHFSTYLLFIILIWS